MLDPVGDVFTLLRELELPAALWRVRDAGAKEELARSDLTVFGVDGALDWDALAELGNRAPIVVITKRYDRAEAQEALQRDLAGYLDAAMPKQALARAIVGAVLHDEPAFARDVIGAWLRERRSKAADGGRLLSGLTQRQQQIIELIARGATDKEIAAALGIAQATAQKHVTNILQRLRVPNRAAAVAAVATIAHRRRR